MAHSMTDDEWNESYEKFHRILLRNSTELAAFKRTISYLNSDYYYYDFVTPDWLCYVYLSNESDLALLKIKHPTLFVY